MERRRERTEEVVRDILRHRHVWELPAPSSNVEAAYEGVRGLDREPEIRFRRPTPTPVGARGRLVHWLFREGGMCPVLILSLLIYGLAAAVFLAH